MVTTLECATAGCAECREKVKAAHRFTPEYEKPKLHVEATHVQPEEQ